ncbi:21381_t:CDS:2, partial [Gigaspora margarita]
MHPTLQLFAKKIREQHVKRGLFASGRLKYLYPKSDPLPDPPPKPPKIKKVKKEPPWMVQQTYKQALTGLYAGKHIQYGNQISEFGNKSRRTWRPNVQKVKLYSEALNDKIPIKVTPLALKIMDRKGGLDKYLLSMRDKDLGEPIPE